MPYENQIELDNDVIPGNWLTYFTIIDVWLYIYNGHLVLDGD